MTELLAVGDVVHLLHTANRGWLLAQLPAGGGRLRRARPPRRRHGGPFRRLRFLRQQLQPRRAVEAPAGLLVQALHLFRRPRARLLHGERDQRCARWSSATAISRTSGARRTMRGEFNGPTRMREALVNSLNLVSVRILMGTGIERGDAATSRRLASTTRRCRATCRWRSAAAAPRPGTWPAGFSVFANGGRRVEHYVVDRVVDAARPDGLPGRAAARLRQLRRTRAQRRQLRRPAEFAAAAGRCERVRRRRLPAAARRRTRCRTTEASRR